MRERSDLFYLLLSCKQKNKNNLNLSELKMKENAEIPHPISSLEIKFSVNANSDTGTLGTFKPQVTVGCDREAGGRLIITCHPLNGTYVWCLNWAALTEF